MKQGIILIFIILTTLNGFCQDSVLFENDRVILKSLSEIKFKLNENCYEDTSSKIKIPIQNGIEYDFDVHTQFNRFVLKRKGADKLKEYDSTGKFIRHITIPIGTTTLYSNAENNLYCLIPNKEPQVFGVESKVKKTFFSYTNMFKYLDIKGDSLFDSFEFPGESFGGLKEIPNYFYNSKDSFIVFISNYYLYKYHIHPSKSRKNGVYYFPTFENFRITPLFFNETHGIYYDKYKGLMFFDFETGSIKEIMKNKNRLSTIIVDACSSNNNENIIYVPIKVSVCNLAVMKCIIINK